MARGRFEVLKESRFDESMVAIAASFRL
jgi:hypothetical protein